MLNLDIDPCNDFYEFACGNLVTVKDIELDNLETIGKVIEEGYKVNENLTLEEQEYDKKNFEKVADLYNSCINTETINAMGLQPVLDIFSKLEIDKNKIKYNSTEYLTNLLVKLDNYGLNLLFKTEVFENVLNPTVNALYIHQPNLGLEIKEYYEDNNTVISYKNIMKSIFTKLYQDKKESNIEKIVESVFEFEKKLIDISLTRVEIENLNYFEDLSRYIPTVETLNTYFSFIDWKTYFNKRYEDLGLESPIDNDTIIINRTPHYFEKLNNVLIDTDSETIAAYAEWTFIRNYSRYFSDEINEIFTDYYNKFEIFYPTDDYTRKIFCIAIFNNYLVMDAGKLFVEKTFGGESKEIIENMTENIKESLIKSITKNTWLDESTKENALLKASYISQQVGYPDYIMNPKELYKHYEGIEINPNELFNNIINNKIYSIYNSLNSYGKEVNQDNWIMSPFTWDAYYYPLDNKIRLPAGYFQKPVFSSTYPNYLNYGSVGSVIGHELTHAFDSNGKEYDYDGSLNNWWTPSTQKEFDNLSQCFIDQYNQYYFKDSKGNKHYLSGEKTLAENIADNGGLSFGYEAWKLSLKKDPKAKEMNKNLPGLSQFTQDQLFFISYAQNWCDAMTESFEIHFIETNEHSTPRLRVLGTLTNNKYFSEVFNCPINSPMNPEKKCKIW